ncbi:MAG TPA: DUF3426 domain-containing protein [Gammaproteobacteria bacterium]|nr:DUF3426 domain-containing protein [Gammaproteobacteria bacterium]
MYTRCPECNTVFRIARAQLDAADGEVRCGRCNGIFNALEALIEDLPQRGESASPDVDDEAITDMPDEPVAAGRAADDDEALLEFSLPEDRWAEVFLDHELGGEESGPRTGPGAFDDQPPAHASRGGEPPVLVREDAPAGANTQAATDSGLSWDSSGSGVLGPLVLRSQAARRSGRRYWTFASVVLLAALAVQIVHLNRTALAGLPWLGDIIERAYDQAGTGLDRPARLTDYRIVTAAASMEARNDGLLRVHATVANSAEHAQQYPLIRLTLKDRWGESVGERLIEHAEYAVGEVTPGALLAPGASIDAEIRIVDPGTDAFGFELDICLRNAQGQLACASDYATR